MRQVLLTFPPWVQRDGKTMVSNPVGDEALVLGWCAVRKRYEWDWVRDGRNCS